MSFAAMSGSAFCQRQDEAEILSPCGADIPCLPNQVWQTGMSAPRNCEAQQFEQHEQFEKLDLPPPRAKYVAERLL
jgi:hypothetical protein